MTLRLTNLYTPGETDHLHPHTDTFHQLSEANPHSAVTLSPSPPPPPTVHNQTTSLDPFLSNPQDQTQPAASSEPWTLESYLDPPAPLLIVDTGYTQIESTQSTMCLPREAAPRASEP